MPAPTRRNDIPLLTQLDGKPVSHFRLREFENAEGLAMVHPRLLEALERTRRDLCATHRQEIWLIVTDATRTQADLEGLAQRHGWIGQGGKVSRDSKHLTKYGGIAADLVAVNASTREPIPQNELGAICRTHFDYVKDDYTDGHVHADMRKIVSHFSAPQTQPRPPHRSVRSV